MAIKKLILSALSLVLCFSICSGQEAAGLIFGQNNGINATKINPAFAFNSANKWDIQIGGAQLFFQTDYGYINESNLFNTASNTGDIEIHNFPDDAIESAAPLSAIFKTDNTNSYIHGKAEVFGPGFMFDLNPKIKMGIFTRGRSFASIADVPAVLNYYTLDNTIIDQQYDGNNFTSAAAGWNEIGLLYAHKINKNIVLGASFKYNVGITSASFRIDSPFSYFSQDPQTIEPVDFGDFQIGYANIDPDRMNGNGLGLDLGITIANLFSEGSSLGISILDLGFTKYNGRSFFGSYDQMNVIDRATYSSISNPRELLDQVETDFNVRSEHDESFIDHPTMLSIQYLHPINNNIAIQAAFSQGINIKKSEFVKGSLYPSAELLRSNSMLLTGVYETPNYSVFLPITLYNYERLNTGLAFRAYFLTIGSDDIGSLFGKRNFDGTDIYVNLNIYPFLKKKKSDDVPCFSF